MGNNPPIHTLYGLFLSLLTHLKLKEVPDHTSEKIIAYMASFSSNGIYEIDSGTTKRLCEKLGIHKNTYAAKVNMLVELGIIRRLVDSRGLEYDKYGGYQVPDVLAAMKEQYSASGEVTISFSSRGFIPKTRENTPVVIEI